MWLFVQINENKRNCCLHLQAREIVEHGHQISVNRVHVKLDHT